MKYKDPISGEWKEVYIKVSDTLPVGAICQYGGTTAPSGYLMCNGQAISRIDYAELFSAIGTTFGSGDGVTTFNVPNFNGRVPVGIDSTQGEFDTLGETGGSKYLQEHYHDTIYWGGQVLYAGESIDDAANQIGVKNNSGSNNQAYKEKLMTSPAGTGNSGNLQPYLVTNFIIKASKKVALDKGEVVNVASESTEDAYSCDYMNDCNTYSTDETFTGKYWKSLNGTLHKIYRKVYVSSGQMTPNAWTTFDTLSDVSLLLKGLFGEGTNKSVWNDTCVRVSNNNIQYYAPLGHTYDFLILEYTKTTD